MTKTKREQLDEALDILSFNAHAAIKNGVGDATFEEYYKAFDLIESFIWEEPDDEVQDI